MSGEATVRGPWSSVSCSNREPQVIAEGASRLFPHWGVAVKKVLTVPSLEKSHV